MRHHGLAFPLLAVLGLVAGVAPAQAPTLLFSVTGQSNLSTSSGITGEQLGSAVCAVGDLNFDGVPEILAGAPQGDAILPPNTLPTSQTGRARLFDGATGAVLFNYTGNANGGFLGKAVAAMGDIDGDTIPDFAIAEAQILLPPLPFGPPTPPASVRVYSGANPATPLRVHVSPSPAGDSYGESIASGGDLDGDGISDLVVGARTAGLVYAYSGATGNLIYTISGGTGIFFGAVVAIVPDANGDGTADILVGARTADPGGLIDAGEASLFSGATGALLVTLAGQVAGDGFGTGLCGLGDVDFDGIGDFAVTAFRADGNGADAGRVTVFSGFNWTPLWSVDGSASTDFFGVGAVEVGDVDGDGARDLMVGANQGDNGAIANCGYVQILSGTDGRLLGTLYGQAAENRIGLQTSLAAAGDFDLDGFPDLVIGEGRYDAAVNDVGAVRVISLGKFMGPCARGNTGALSGGPYDVLLVGGQSGGLPRRVDLGIGQPLAFSVVQPPSNPNPASFAIFGYLGVPGTLQVFGLPFGIGLMCFAPNIAAPGDPSLFLLASSFLPPDPSQLLFATPTPWSFTYLPGVPFAADFALQGVIVDTPFSVGVTNGVLVSVH